MSDLRQGVTPLMHDVLDRLDAMRNIPSSSLTPRMMLQSARASAERAIQREGDIARIRRADAIDAAARMLLMVELLDAELGR